MPRRGENIYKRKDGRWEGRIYRRTHTGERVYQSVYGKNYREVKDKMSRLKPMEPTGKKLCTMEEAAQMWIQSQSAYWKAGTCAAYRQMLKKYIIPYLGQMDVRQITDRTLLDFIRKVNQRENQKTLSENYMFQICSMVRRIMVYMGRQCDGGIVIPRNPVSSKQVNNMILPSEKSLTVLEEYLNSHCDNDDTCLGLLIALHTGIRIGELSALTWKEIDIREEVLYIRKNLIRVQKAPGSGPKKPKERATQIVEQTPKTSDSIRLIPLPPCLLSILEKRQKDESDYVVSGTKSPWAEPRTIQYRFKHILERCEIEYFNIHMLRHAFATRCVAFGLDLKSLSEILGHSDIQITLKRYVHSTMQQKRMLMQQYDSIVH